MPDRIAGNPPSASMPQERICRNCGRTFILRQNEQEAFAARGWDLPKICMECNRAAGEQRERTAAAGGSEMAAEKGEGTSNFS